MIDKKYFKLTENVGGFTHIKVVITYNLGGINYFNMSNEPRGYYASVYPMQVGENFEVTRGFSGYKVFLFGVQRKSKNAESAAIQELNKKLPLVIQVLLTKHNIALENPNENLTF